MMTATCPRRNALRDDFIVLPWAVLAIPVSSPVVEHL
jgi:hypothetical protein